MTKFGNAFIRAGKVLGVNIPLAAGPAGIAMKISAGLLVNYLVNKTTKAVEIKIEEKRKGNMSNEY